MRASRAIICAVVTVFPSLVWADVEWGGNPFAFGKQTETAPEKNEPSKSKRGELSVEMTIAQGDTRLAVVNGRKVTIGDSVDGAVISAITMDSVTFVRNGKTLTRPVGGMDNDSR